MDNSAVENKNKWGWNEMEAESQTDYEHQELY